jgi:hypothetical protein
LYYNNFGGTFGSLFFQTIHASSAFLAQPSIDTAQTIVVESESWKNMMQELKKLYEDSANNKSDVVINITPEDL